MLKLNLLYFAQLRESLGIARETLECQARTVEDLVSVLADRGGIWQEQLQDSEALRIAVNQEMVRPSCELSSGAEVAFFRPVTGG